MFFYGIVILCLQHRGNNIKKDIWDKQGYTTTNQISTLYVDNTRKCFYVIGCMRVYSFSDIKDFKIVTNQNKPTTVNYIAVYIYVNDINCPLVKMVLLTTETSMNSMVYRSNMDIAEQINALLMYIKNEN